MAKRVNRGLPFKDWPPEDQSLWGNAFGGDDVFHKRQGARLSKTSIYGRKASYGKYLGFIKKAQPELLRLSSAARIKPDVLKAYVDCLRQNCRETTIAIDLERLFFALRAMFPTTDWSWLYSIARRIAAGARPIRHPQILSPDVYRLAIDLMERASFEGERIGKVTFKCAVDFRDGLQIATLTEAPMRRGAFSRLQIGAHAVRIGDRWWLFVPGDLTKTDTPQDYELSERLSRYIDIYLERFRIVFPRADSHDGLWPYIGRPMTDKMIWRHFKKRTLVGLGVAIGPHRLRSADATFLSIADPENIRAARDLLGHKSFSMTEKHYIHGAQSRLAGRELARLLAAHGRCASPCPVPTGPPD
ncbi:MAG: hypothetical protein E5W91_32040 [Mesorhizobium sp.]|uniref:tyrosine-type recombinase/integrase n=1 Tax=Mesorhizobium sp. TaxID=1871066 RepID=UPI001221D75B|nr:tyrosine-type recombinase/integrase [Mesorhizobium sp.]TIS53196.1 MAG: hypothetical protein E5W91_32040 [Mesorhizobium sp.]